MGCQFGTATDPNFQNMPHSPAIVWCFTHNCRVGSGGCERARIEELETALVQPVRCPACGILIRRGAGPKVPTDK